MTDHIHTNTPRHGVEEEIVQLVLCDGPGDGEEEGQPEESGRGVAAAPLLHA